MSDDAPNWEGRRFTRRKTNTLIALVWLAAIAVAVLPNLWAPYRHARPYADNPLWLVTGWLMHGNWIRRRGLPAGQRQAVNRVSADR